VTGLITEVLRQQINSRHSSDKARLALFSFLLAEAPDIRKRMAEPDGSFRHKFRSTLWPRFIQLAGPDRWDFYASVPGLWTVLEDPAGVDLIRKYLHLPFFLFEKYRKPGERELVRQALLAPDELMLIAMALCCDDELFHEFLRRKGITSQARRNILYHLVALDKTDNNQSSHDLDQGQRRTAARRHEIFEYVRTLSADAVDKEYGARESWTREIPLIGDILFLGEKFVTGRKTTWADYAAAGADVLDGLLIFVSPGDSSTVKAVAYDATKEVVGAARKQVSEYANTLFLQQLQDSIIGHKQDSIQTLLPQTPLRASYLLTAILMGAQFPTQRNAPAQVVDLMPVVQLLVDQSGIGKHSLDRLTRWQVGLTLREGGRVFASIGSNQVPHIPPGLAANLDTSSIRDLLRNERDPEKLQRAWQRNVYAWWSALLTEK
jgi:hypothetical protein